MLVLTDADELQSVLYMDAAYSWALGHAPPCRARIVAVEHMGNDGRYVFAVSTFTEFDSG